MKRTNVIRAALVLATAAILAMGPASAAPRKKPAAHAKPIPVKPVVENPIAIFRSRNSIMVRKWPRPAPPASKARCCA